MKLNWLLIAVAYALALVFFLMPVTEVVLAVWPLRAGEASWRFGAMGVLSQAYVTPLLGAVMFVITALLLYHRRTALLGGIITAFIVVLLLIALPLFALDAIQIRSQVRAEALNAFDESTLIAGLKLFSAFIVLLMLTIGAFKTLRANRAPASAERTPLLARRSKP